MAGWLMMRWLGRFQRDQAGTASVLPMFMLVGLLLAGGFSIDSGNLWFNGEVLRATADAAAHAGVVALSQGDDPVTAAGAALGLNMEAEVFAGGPGKARSDLVRAWHYDAVTDALSEDGAINAVSVQIRRGPDDGNPVPMYLLNLFGLPEWSTAATAVVTLTPTQLCSNANGLFARDMLVLDADSEVGSGFCLHSQSEVALERRVRFDDGASVSMPDLARCDGRCDDTVNPGAGQAAHEANLIGSPIGDEIGRIAAEFLGAGLEAPEKADFFASRPISDDLEPLVEIGIPVTGLGSGSVLRMSAWDFEVLREVPQGLVYAVSCDLTATEPPVLRIRGGLNGPVVNNVALVTNCALHFEDDVEVTGSLLISTYSGDLPSISVDPFAVLGDPSVTCDAGAQAQVLAFGDQDLPASLLVSNVALAIDGNVTLLGGDNGTTASHHGFALHASGAIRVKGHHSFEGCGAGSLATLPALQVIRFVMPKVPAQPRVPVLVPKMPGEATKPLPSTPPLPMSRVPQVVSQVEGTVGDVGL